MSSSNYFQIDSSRDGNFHLKDLLSNGENLTVLASDDGQFLQFIIQSETVFISNGDTEMIIPLELWRTMESKRKNEYIKQRMEVIKQQKQTQSSNSMKRYFRSKLRHLRIAFGYGIKLHQTPKENDYEIWFPEDLETIQMMNGTRLVHIDKRVKSSFKPEGDVMTLNMRKEDSIKQYGFL